MVQEVTSNFPEFRPYEFRENDTDPHMPRVYPVDAAGRPMPVLKYYVDDGCLIAPTDRRSDAAYSRLVWYRGVAATATATADSGSDSQRAASSDRS